MEELKPCPFCGGEANIKTGSHGVDGTGLFHQLHSIACAKCGATTGKTYRTEFRCMNSGYFQVVKDGYADAALDWNRRA